jgi:oligosaccharide reducing-end xylanase
VRARWVAAVSALPALCAVASCGKTIDSIGSDGVGSVRLNRVSGPATYPNPFKDLGKTDAEIAVKIADTFQKLFYGDPNLQAIYVPVGTDQAYIQDTLHGDIRTEGIGLAMMICIQLDKRAEFDRLWTYADTQMKQKDPPRRGYFESRCDTLLATTTPCDDPYGEQQMVNALIFAHGRWGSTTGPVNYEAGAVALLDVMRHKEDENGGIVDGITNTFDSTEALPYHLPELASPVVGRPSIVMPAYYDLWRQATGDPFWTRAAEAARGYWKKSAHPMTGLMPVRATFEGVPDAYWGMFDSEAYRAHVNMALDWAWARGEKDEWEVQEANKLLQFFTMKGMGIYGSAYSIDGAEVIDSLRDLALIAVNGTTAMVATNVGRDAYVNAVWEMSTQTGLARYYSGILHLTALLILSGQYRVW